MARVYFYVMFAIIISLLITFVGVEGASDGGLLEQVGILTIEDGDITVGSSNSPFLIAVLGIIGLTILGGLTVGLFLKIDISLLMAGFITAVLSVTFVGALWNIIIITNGFENYIKVPVLLIMLPFTIGYIFSLYEHFRSNT